MEERTPSRPGSIRGLGGAAWSSKNIFSGLSFILTKPTAGQARPELGETEYSEESEEMAERAGDGEKFDRKSLREVIESQGGTLLTEFPLAHTESWNVSTLDTTVICVSPSPSRTMNYLLCLAHGVPVVSHRFILDSVRFKRLAERSAYLLPAGFSELLGREVEQNQDNREELRVNECLLPLAPANRTRQSRKVKEVESGGGSGGWRKILSGLHVLVISSDQRFTQDWQSVLDSLGASVTARHQTSDRLGQIRVPDVTVTDSQAPANICKVREEEEEIFLKIINIHISGSTGQARHSSRLYKVDNTVHRQQCQASL